MAHDDKRSQCAFKRPTGIEWNSQGLNGAEAKHSEPNSSQFYLKNEACMYPLDVSRFSREQLDETSRFISCIVASLEARRSDVAIGC
jgi:hypothetical protein